jgi:hypothetical protein
VPLTKLQSHVLRVLAAERSPDSYVAGGVAINREGPRFSDDIDIFQDTEQRLEAAAADRREPRDIVDLATIHETILPLGAAICAAVGRFPGQSPEEMLADITRHSRFTAEEFRVLATERPIDVPNLHRLIRSMIEDAERFISRIPSDAIGVVFLERGKAVQPDLDALEKYQRHTGASGGVWPSSSEISSAMLERYKKQNGNDREPKP